MHHMSGVLHCSANSKYFHFRCRGTWWERAEVSVWACLLKKIRGTQAAQGRSRSHSFSLADNTLAWRPTQLQLSAKLPKMRAWKAVHIHMWRGAGNTNLQAGLSFLILYTHSVSISSFFNPTLVLVSLYFIIYLFFIPTLILVY